MGIEDVLRQRPLVEGHGVEVGEVGEHWRDRGPQPAFEKGAGDRVQGLPGHRGTVGKVVDDRRRAGADHGDGIDQGADRDVTRGASRAGGHDVQHVDVEGDAIDRPLEEGGVGMAVPVDEAGHDDAPRRLDGARGPGGARWLHGTLPTDGRDAAALDPHLARIEYRVVGIASQHPAATNEHRVRGRGGLVAHG